MFPKKKKASGGQYVLSDIKKFGRVRNRTGDLSHAKGARYRLRHTPKDLLINWLLSSATNKVFTEEITLTMKHVKIHCNKSLHLNQLLRRP